VHRAEFNGNTVCIKALRAYSQDTRGATKRVRLAVVFSPRTTAKNWGWQAFLREVVVWKRLRHPNIVPFLGVPDKIPPFEIVCEWMENGKITDYVLHHPLADPVDLVSGPMSVVTAWLISNIAVVGRDRRASLPPLMRDHTW
jgi:serine/threonine protein kinase